MSSDKLAQLRQLLRSYGSCLVAYSGGVDSAFLACVAREVLGEKSLAVIADSPSLPRRELSEALALAEAFHFPVRVIRTREFENPNYTSNPVNRCYFCKHELFTELAPIARAEGFQVIAYGENASDAGDYRPGSQAAAEFQVRAPLREAGLTKPEIRECSSALGLPTAEKPQMACLSSRIPQGEPVTPRKLDMVEQAEELLHNLGFYDIRVRHHELPAQSLPAAPPLNGLAFTAPGLPNSEIRIPQSALRLPHSSPRALARIEVGPEEFGRFLSEGNAARIAEALKRLGYAHVTLDLMGYRRGSANGVREAQAQAILPKTRSEA